MVRQSAHVEDKAMKDIDVAREYDVFCGVPAPDSNRLGFSTALGIWRTFRLLSFLLREKGSRWVRRVSGKLGRCATGMSPPHINKNNYTSVEVPKETCKSDPIMVDLEHDWWVFKT